MTSTVGNEPGGSSRRATVTAHAINDAMNNRKSIAALTGDIGSGKSFICQLLRQYGITVHDCNEVAKRLIQEDSQLRQQLTQLVGPDVYEGTGLQKSMLAQPLLTSETNKQAVSDIVHPTITINFPQSPSQWAESAILSDAHFDRRIKPDMVICVTTPLQVRAKRITFHGTTSHEKATAWISSQVSQDEMAQLSDMEIINDGKANLPQQIEKISELLHRNHIL